MEKPGLTRLCQSTDYMQVELPRYETDRGIHSRPACEHRADPPAKQKACRWGVSGALAVTSDRAVWGEGGLYWVSNWKRMCLDLHPTPFLSPVRQHPPMSEIRQWSLRGHPQPGTDRDLFSTQSPPHEYPSFGLCNNEGFLYLEILLKGLKATHQHMSTYSRYVFLTKTHSQNVFFQTPTLPSKFSLMENGRRCSISSVIREVQIQTTLYFPEGLECKRTRTKCWYGCGQTELPNLAARV